MKNKNGFTLMEMLMVIGTIALLSVIAVPSVVAWRNGAQMGSAVRLVKNYIEQTRLTAIKSNMPARMEFTDGANTFDTVRWDPEADAFAAPVVVSLPPGFAISTNFVGDRLQFNSNGMLNSFGGTLRVESVASDLCRLIVVTGAGSSRIDTCP